MIHELWRLLHKSSLCCEGHQGKDQPTCKNLILTWQLGLFCKYLRCEQQVWQIQNKNNLRLNHCWQCYSHCWTIWRMCYQCGGSVRFLLQILLDLRQRLQEFQDIAVFQPCTIKMEHLWIVVLNILLLILQGICTGPCSCSKQQDYLQPSL